jgi:NDP-sugar pyrophosphorylase family protein
MTHVDAGVMVFKKDILNLIPKGRLYSLEEEVYKKLIEAGTLKAFVTDQRFYDMGNPEGLEIIEGILQ